MKLTKEMIEKAKPNSIMFEGTTIDNADGLNMTGNGQELRYVIYRGGIADWCIYVHTTDKTPEWIAEQGDKPHSRENIANVVEFNNEVWKMYRH